LLLIQIGLTHKAVLVCGSMVVSVLCMVLSPGEATKPYTKDKKCVVTISSKRKRPPMLGGPEKRLIRRIQAAESMGNTPRGSPRMRMTMPIVCD